VTKVKICGINDTLGFDAAVHAGADWIGFVFFARSPRYISPQTAASLSDRTPGGPLRVGLFVEPSDQAINTVLDNVRLDVIQVYGRAIDVAAMKARIGLPVWRPVGVAGLADLPHSSSGADGLILEAKPTADATRPGGNATTFNWSLLQGWSAPAPWILAGGLIPANVASAVRQTGAAAVDVSSGVESRLGVKDAALIRAFIAAARNGDHAS